MVSAEWQRHHRRLMLLRTIRCNDLRELERMPSGAPGMTTQSRTLIVADPDAIIWLDSHRPAMWPSMIPKQEDGWRTQIEPLRLALTGLSGRALMFDFTSHAWDVESM